MVRSPIFLSSTGEFRFVDDIYKYTGRRPGAYWTICWRFISPTIIAVIFVASIIIQAMDSAEYSVWIKEEVRIYIYIYLFIYFWDFIRVCCTIFFHSDLQVGQMFPQSYLISPVTSRYLWHKLHQFETLLWEVEKLEPEILKLIVNTQKQYWKHLYSCLFSGHHALALFFFFSFCRGK